MCIVFVPNVRVHSPNDGKNYIVIWQKNQVYRMTRFNYNHCFIRKINWNFNLSKT